MKRGHEADAGRSCGDGQRCDEQSYGNLGWRAQGYERRAPWIVDIAKSRLRTAARWIGEIVRRKQAEERLRVSEEQLRSLSDYLDTVLLNLPIGVAIVEGEDLKYFRINRKLAEINGLSVEDHLGRPLAEVLPMGAPKLIPLLRRVLESGKPAAPVELRLGLPESEGQQRDFEPHFFPIFVGEDERPRAVGAAVIEVTERKLAQEALKQAHGQLEKRVAERTSELSRVNTRLREEAAERQRVELVLRESEQRLREQFAELDQLYRTAPVGLCLLDRDLRYLRINERLAAVNGPPVAAHIGRTVREVIPQLADTVVPMYRCVVETGEPILNREVTGKNPAQPEEVGYWWVSSYPLKWADGAVWGLSIVVQDITARKRAEEQARQHLEELAHVSRLSTMGEMVTGIAHELNQPLAAMVNFAFAALHKLRDDDSPKAEELRNVLGSLSEEALRAGKIVQRLRDFTKKTQRQRAVTGVNELVSEVLELLESELRLNSVHLDLRLTEQLPQVSADGIQIQQVIFNLARNALEAMADVAPDERCLEVATRAPSRGTVEVAICDSGMGLRAENAERVFDAFFTTKDKGMGMGLAISRSIIEDHGGRLWAEAKNTAGGTTFRFSLPVAESDGDTRD